MLNIKYNNIYLIPQTRNFSANEYSSRLTYLVESCYLDNTKIIKKIILFDPYFAYKKITIENLLRLINIEDEHRKDMINLKLYSNIDIYTNKYDKKVLETLNNKTINKIKNITIYNYLNQKEYKFHDRYLFFLDKNNEIYFYMIMNKGFDDLSSNKQMYRFSVCDNGQFDNVMCNNFLKIINNSKKIFEGGKLC